MLWTSIWLQRGPKTLDPGTVQTLSQLPTRPRPNARDKVHEGHHNNVKSLRHSINAIGPAPHSAPRLVPCLTLYCTVHLSPLVQAAGFSACTID
jgi:hypothetical protein